MKYEEPMMDVKMLERRNVVRTSLGESNVDDGGNTGNDFSDTGNDFA